MKKFRRILTIFLVSVLLIGLIGGSVAIFGTYSSGFRVGSLVKFSKKGVVLKTYEGQINMGGIGGGDGGDLSPTVWGFSVYRSDKQVIKEIEEAMDSGNQVKLYYKEKFLQFDLFGDTKNFIYKVEQIKPKPASSPMTL
ncbi:hypothetical protein [Pontibacter sp. G13]|uniref:hypothetical protein n=1 Tax=Pontibacter sp. G13 TaxID=3074898 RepID=UPI00288BA96A|nr:hypothetical protein [Pontibacter sp. G13]WNJ15928.1 hypothetical protein RJD25_13775 [Pontibacter sp. G13]